MTREQKIHSAATFVMDGTAASGFFAFPLYLYSLGATEGQVGQISAVRFGVYTLACLGSGRLARTFRVGPLIAAAGALVWCLGHFGMPFIGTPLGVAVAGTIASLGLAAFWPAIEAWTGEAPDDRSIIRRLVAFNLTWGIAVTLTPYPTGELWESVGKWAFLFAAGGGVTAGALALSLVRFRGQAVAVERTDGRQSDAPTAQRFLLVAWSASALSYFLLGIHREIFPKLALQMGIGAAALGAFLSIRQGLQALGFVLCGRWLGWRFTYRWLLIGQILCVASFVLLARANSPAVAAVSYVLCGAYAGIAYFTSMYYSVADRTHRERRAGFHEAMVGVGFFLGPLLAGSIAEDIGLRASFTIVPVAAGAAVIGLQVWWLHRHRNQVPDAGARKAGGDPPHKMPPGSDGR